ncbi:rrna processing protein [Stylonychia lemnae]|uniref:rRNA biogenesis protein RRP36 n=1 Tax=Stylonychia lemnae TaxID=5949 RepID=A0A078AAQ8_STYLE|nr:rrna processing protein [Stylonychia lemnae]|eukprot:CDW79299.1 rrna processing protein [Stylonychia lemnae]
MTFEERLKLKQRSAFDVIKNKEQVLERKEKAEKQKLNAQKVGKKMPRERYSKLQVSILRPINIINDQPKLHTRDPRFDNRSGTLNQGLFQESYAFIKEYQDERFQQLGEKLRSAKKQGDKDQIKQIRDLIGNDKSFMNKNKKQKQEKEVIQEQKKVNKERAEKGLQPLYLKKREIKEMQVKQKFEKLDKDGNLEKFIQRKQEEKDKKRR